MKLNPAWLSAPVRLKKETGGDVSVQTAANSYHGFYGPGSVHFGSDVPNGVAWTGVYVGDNAVAVLDTFFRRIFE